MVVTSVTVATAVIPVKSIRGLDKAGLVTSYHRIRPGSKGKPKVVEHEID